MALLRLKMSVCPKDGKSYVVKIGNFCVLGMSYKI
jgi:hypothetical protein